MAPVPWPKKAWERAIAPTIDVIQVTLVIKTGGYRITTEVPLRIGTYFNHIRLLPYVDVTKAVGVTGWQAGTAIYIAPL